MRFHNLECRRFFIFLLISISSILTAEQLQGQSFSQSITCKNDTNINIQLGGMLDGQNCQKVHEYTAGGWPDYKRIPAIEPLDSIVLSNTSTTDISLLQIISNTNNIFSMDSLAQQACTKEAINAEDSIYDIYRYMSTHHYYYYVPEVESRQFKDVTRHQGVYGYGHCGSIGNCATLIGKKLLGPDQRLWYIDQGNHGISELKLNGKYYYLDADEEMIIKDRRNKRYLSFGEAYDDLFLFYRTKCFGNGLKYSFSNSVSYGALRYFNNIEHQPAESYLYSHVSCYVEDTVGNYGPELGFTLKAGEKMTWSYHRDNTFGFHHYPRFYCSGTNYGFLPDSTNILPVVRNVKTKYDLFAVDQPIQNKFIHSSNIQWLFNQHLIKPTTVNPSGFTWYRYSYFPYVSGRLNIEAEFQNTTDSVQVFISFNNQTWQQLTTLTSLHALAGIPLDSAIRPHTSLSKHRIYLKTNFFTTNVSTAVAIKKFVVELNVQNSAFLYPGLLRGDNRFQIKLNDTLTNGELQATMYWREHNENQPPQPPQMALYPLHNATVNKTDIPFRWQQILVDQEGDSIQEWHFQLSEYSDFHRVLANNFDYMSLNAEKAKSYFLNYFDTVLSRNTFFNHNTTYYWRIRIRDARNAWSTWSPAWRFTVQAPMPVRNLHFEPVHNKPDQMTLIWQKDEQDQLTNQYRILNNNLANSLYPHPSQITNYYSTSNVYTFNIDTNKKAFRVFAIDAANNCSAASAVVSLPVNINLDMNDILDLTDTIDLLQHPFPAYPSLGRNYFLLYDTNFFQPVSQHAVRFRSPCSAMVNICYTDDSDTIYKRQYLIHNKRYNGLAGVCATDELIIFPNPSFHIIHVQGDDTGMPKYLFNSVGSLLLQTTSNDIDLSSLSSGIYFLKLNGSVKKILVN